MEIFRPHYSTLVHLLNTELDICKQLYNERLQQVSVGQVEYMTVRTIWEGHACTDLAFLWGWRICFRTLTLLISKLISTCVSCSWKSTKRNSCFQDSKSPQLKCSLSSSVSTCHLADWTWMRSASQEYAIYLRKYQMGQRGPWTSSDVLVQLCFSPISVSS